MTRHRHAHGLAVVIGLAFIHADADADAVRLDVATEVDSNVHRVDGALAASQGELSRVTANGRGHRTWGDVAAWGDGRLGMRYALRNDQADENALTLGGEAGIGVQANEQVRWVLRGGGLWYGGTAAQSSVRELAMGNGDVTLILGNTKGHRAWARAGAGAVIVPDVGDSSYRGASFETGWSWSKDDDDAVAQWNTDVSYERSLRRFDGVGLIEGCTSLADVVCAVATKEPRRDDVQTLSANVQRSQRVIWGVGYSVSHQRSTLERLSSWRHSVQASLTSRVAGKLFATARIRLQYDRYPDGATLYENGSQTTEVNLLESDQRNEGMLLLAYRASRALSVEGLVYVWRDGFGVGDRSYKRVLASLGVGYAFGRDK